MKLAEPCHPEPGKHYLRTDGERSVKYSFITIIPELFAPLPSSPALLCILGDACRSQSVFVSSDVREVGAIEKRCFSVMHNPTVAVEQRLTLAELNMLQRSTQD